ncbi:MAG: hypothetical protein JWQ98_1947 [Chlorobi bacterium]|nr:hypothetical protein [Chlorobiota bacterium]
MQQTNAILSVLARTLLPFLGVLTLAQAAPIPHGPRIRALCGATCNLGRLGPGEHYKSITIVNDGDDTLRILDSDDGCDCFFEEYDRSEIPPGEQAQVSFAIVSPEFPTTFSQSLTIKSNDPVQPLLKLEIVATFWRDFTLTPPFLRLSDDKPCSGECKVTVEIRNTGDQATTLEPPEVTSAEGMEVRSVMKHPITLKRGATFKLDLFILVDPSVLGPHAELRMLTSARETPILPLGVMYNRMMPVGQ